MSSEVHPLHLGRATLIAAMIALPIAMLSAGRAQAQSFNGAWGPKLGVGTASHLVSYREDVQREPPKVSAGSRLSAGLFGWWSPLYPLRLQLDVFYSRTRYSLQPAGQDALGYVEPLLNYPVQFYFQPLWTESFTFGAGPGLHLQSVLKRGGAEQLGGEERAGLRASIAMSVEAALNATYGWYALEFRLLAPVTGTQHTLNNDANPLDVRSLEFLFFLSFFQ